jgi:putative ABC transport system permease protein
MNTLVRLAARNIFRRRTRTLLTAGMVVFGVALLLVALTWIHGAFGTMLSSAAAANGHVRIVDRDFAIKEELMPLDEHLADIPRWVELLAAQPGVTAVEPRLVTGVTVTVGEEIGDVFGGLIGASERYFRERLGAKDKLTSGAWFSGDPDEIIAGAKIVELAGAKLGDEMLLLGLTQDGSISPVKGRIVGVFRTGGALDQQIFAPLEKVQFLADITEGATEILVYTSRYEDAERLSARLSALPELRELTVQPFSERDPWKSLAGVVRTVRAIIILTVVLLTALGIWNTMMMSVLERTHEIGVLRAMGLSKLGTVGLFVGEGLAIALIGGVLGLGLGAYPAWLLETKGIRIGEQTAANLTTGISETVYGDLSVETLIIAFGLGLLMAVFGSLVPAVRAANIQPVSAMRSGR